MFERFTDEARRTVVLATEVARERTDRSIEVVHMFAGLAAGGEAAVLAAGLDRERIERLWDDVRARTGANDGLDAEALAGIGIDVEAVRHATDREFGRGALDRIRHRQQLRPSPGHLPFSANLKKALGLSLTHAKDTDSRGLTPTHLLLGLLDVDDPHLAGVLSAAGVTVADMRAAAIASLTVEPAAAPTSTSVRSGLDHVSVGVADLDAATGFYDAALTPLGIRRLVRTDDVAGYGSDRPYFWVGRARTDGPAREVHLAFAAPDRRAVYFFRDAAVEVGAEVLNEPRVFTEYHPSYFAAFVRDPDGNNVEAVCHAPTPG
jgi:catechol 2,3-dioxygenase-like lactoylglutathione lyase family enzyme